MNSKKTKKPLRRAKRWGARIWPMAGRLAAILAAVTVMGLMFSALQAVGSMVLRAVISLAILSGVLLMLYSEGLTRGVADADASHAADKLEKLGSPLSRREEAACYQPMKALCACLIGYLRAPAVYAKRQSMQRRAKKAAVRKAQKKSMVSELLGSGGDVHYGQRPQQEEHKKKELI